MIREAIRNWLMPETRSADPRLHPDAWSRAFPSSAFANAGGVESNIPVALACVHLQATVLAGLPFAAYRRLPDGGRERIREGSLARIIDAPNAGMSRFDLIESIVRALHFQGNFYAEVKYDAGGLFEALVPLSPNAVTVEQTQSGAVRLKVSEPGRNRVLVAPEYVHVRMPGNSPTDLVGVSTSQRARGALGLTLELNDAARESADKKMGGFVIQPADTSQRAKRQAAAATQETATDRFSPRVLDPGVKFISNTFSSVDTELLASREFAAAETARIYLTPSAMIGLQKNTSYGSAAQDAENFVVTCLGPLANRIESAFERCLLSDELRADVFFEFSIDGLLRSNPAERFRQYEIGRRVGLYSPNDLRALENMPPRADPAGDAFDPPATNAPDEAEEPIASAKP
jgi:HK97 family phage portal protein